MDWQALFGLSVPPLELIIRGSAIWWFLFLVFRFVMRRDTGSIAIADVLVLVIIADAAQNGMSGEYKSITDGIILISTILGWNYLMDWAAYHWSWADRLIQPRKICLVRHGRPQWEALRREMMTREELMAKLREQGVEHLGEVRHAYMEGDGKVSVIKAE